MEQYWDSIRKNVCRKCIDGDGRSNCRLGREESCALRKFYPQVFSLVTSLETDSYDDYVRTLRERICSVCQQTPDKVCRKRQTLECALDRYYPLIIDVAESYLALKASELQLEPIPNT